LGHGPILRRKDIPAAGLALLFVALGLFACGDKGKPAAEAGSDEVARAQALAAPGAALPARPEVLSVAQAIAARAAREGAGARAVELHTLAGALLEREWRLEGREQDGKEAVHVLRSAARDPSAPGACAAAVRAAQLAGEVARDATTSYAELYRAQRRFVTKDDKSPCAQSLADAMTHLGAFRPPQPVLDAIDQGLAGEGAIAALSATATATAAPSTVPTTARVMKIEQWPGEESTRIVISLDRPARYRVGDEASGPALTPRTYVELDGVDLGGPAKEVPVSGIVTKIRAERISTGTRVSMDLSAGRAFRRVFHLPEPYRVVVDLARNPPGGANQRAASRLVLDPGHGGNDPGAIGPTGVKEKDVTLDIAHRVAPVLAKLGIQVVLTRDDDRYVTLEERTARANAFAADLFISIHCNAADGKARHGVETYVLDTHKDEIAARVAARENATSPAANAELGAILASMRMADQATRSTKLADLLQRSAMASLRMAYPDAHDGGVHTAGFYVLVGARMPGVLFETSYISHPVEEQRLANEDYKQRLADAIVNAVKAYREGR
jgi:N-acetylmuramoyl-L-alanine amidase